MCLCAAVLHRHLYLCLHGCYLCAALNVPLKFGGELGGSQENMQAPHPYHRSETSSVTDACMRQGTLRAIPHTLFTGCSIPCHLAGGVVASEQEP